MRPSLRRRALFAACAALFAAAAPPQFDVPTWRVGDSWRVRRDFVLNLKSDQGGGSMNVREEYDLTVVSIGQADGQLAYRLERGNDDVTGSGTVTLPGQGTFNLNVGPASETTGYELIRVGDLATIEESFNTYLDIRTLVVVFQVTVAEATLQLTQTADPADEGIDFPVEDGNEWAVSSTRAFLGNVSIIFSDLLEGQIEDVDQDINQMVDFSSDWSAGNATGNSVDVVQTPGGQTYVYRDDYRRFASRDLPASQLGLQSFTEAVLSAALAANAGIDFSIAVAGTSANLTGSGASPGGTVEVYIPERGADPAATTTADGSGAFAVSIAIPTGDDSTPSNDDLGSFGVVARDAASGALRARTLRLLEPATVDSTGWLAY